MTVRAQPPTPPGTPMVLFPGALGDLLCLLPAVHGLLQRHPLGVYLVANSAWLSLLGEPPVYGVAFERREIAELYATGVQLSDAARRLFAAVGDVYSWSAYGNDGFRSRLAQLVKGRVQVFPFHGMHASEHAIDYYARCIGVAPRTIGREAVCIDSPCVSAALQSSGIEQRDWLLLHPGSGSPAKNWQGYTALAQRWRRERQQPVVILLGPAEIEPSKATRPPALKHSGEADLVISNPTLPQAAAWLAAAPRYVGNDSGISHLASLCGTRGVVLFGSSDPVTWAPRGPQLKVLHRPDTCEGCGAGVFCTHRLPVDDVLAALESRGG